MGLAAREMLSATYLPNLPKMRPEKPPAFRPTRIQHQQNLSIAQARSAITESEILKKLSADNFAVKNWDAASA
jgi:hypothetical protein